MEKDRAISKFKWDMIKAAVIIVMTALAQLFITWICVGPGTLMIASAILTWMICIFAVDLAFGTRRLTDLSDQ